jgi:hypothetical protein
MASALYGNLKLIVVDKRPPPQSSSKTSLTSNWLHMFRRRHVKKQRWTNAKWEEMSAMIQGRSGDSDRRKKGQQLWQHCETFCFAMGSCNGSCTFQCAATCHANREDGRRWHCSITRRFSCITHSGTQGLRGLPCPTLHPL